jgi:hypothetical protein
MYESTPTGIIDMKLRKHTKTKLNPVLNICKDDDIKEAVTAKVGKSPSKDSER